MQIFQLNNGKFIAADFVTTKRRFRTTYTKSGNPCEAQDYQDLEDATQYASIESVARAIRKKKQADRSKYGR